jgi:hypothetical protein
MKLQRYTVVKPRESDKNELTNKLEIDPMQPYLLKNLPKSILLLLLAKCREKIVLIDDYPLQNPNYYYL